MQYSIHSTTLVIRTNRTLINAVTKLHHAAADTHVFLVWCDFCFTLKFISRFWFEIIKVCVGVRTECDWRCPWCLVLSLSLSLSVCVLLVLSFVLPPSLLSDDLLRGPKNKVQNVRPPTRKVPWNVTGWRRIQSITNTYFNNKFAELSCHLFICSYSEAVTTS